MKNKFIRNGNEVTIYAESKGESYEIQVSAEDLALVSSIPGTWFVKQDGNTYYAWGRLDGKIVQMHRLITNAPKGTEVDHRNHNGLRNTRNNLVVTTKSKNMHNLSKPTKRNTSGKLGVSWNKQAQKWKASIMVDKKQKFLGYFEDLEEASKAVETARKQLNLFKR